MNNTEKNLIVEGVTALQDACYSASTASGWWHDLETGEHLVTRPHIIGEKIALIHSEVSEALEGHRKNLMDDKIPHRKMVEVEFADTIIRIMDTAGALGLDVAGAIVEKMAYNAGREDHKIENRKKFDGKKY